MILQILFLCWNTISVSTLEYAVSWQLCITEWKWKLIYALKWIPEYINRERLANTPKGVSQYRVIADH